MSWKVERNCILLPKLFWPTARKKNSSDREKLLRSLEQFFLTVGQNNFGNKIQFFFHLMTIFLLLFFESRCSSMSTFFSIFLGFCWCCQNRMPFHAIDKRSLFCAVRLQKRSFLLPMKLLEVKLVVFRMRSSLCLCEQGCRHCYVPLLLCPGQLHNRQRQ